jgi:hypothetical protein
MFAYARILACVLVLGLAALADKTASRGLAQCDNYCRERTDFYDCMMSTCLRKAYPDCFCCFFLTGNRCNPNASDGPYPYCEDSGKVILNYYPDNCTKVCDCATGNTAYVEASPVGNNGNAFTLVWYRCNLTQ